MDMKDYLTIVSEFNIPEENILFEDANKETDVISARHSLIESVIVETDEIIVTWDEILSENDANDLSMLIEEMDDVKFYNLNGLLFSHKQQALAAIKSLSKYP